MNKKTRFIVLMASIFFLMMGADLLEGVKTTYAIKFGLSMIIAYLFTQKEKE